MSKRSLGARSRWSIAFAAAVLLGHLLSTPSAAGTAGPVNPDGEPGQPAWLGPVCSALRSFQDAFAGVPSVGELVLARQLALGCSPSVPPGSGVRGTVLFGPVCPVEHDPPDPACAPGPGPAHLTLVRLADGTVVGRGEAGDDGRFVIAAPPGRYVLEAHTDSAVGGCQPVELSVRLGAFADVTVECDTGIQ